jgi:hypothetical protein
MFKALIKTEKGYKDIFETKLAKTDPEALRNTMEQISSMEDIIQWAAVLFSCAEIEEKVEEVKIILNEDDPQHPGFIRIKVKGNKVLFEGEGTI